MIASATPLSIWIYLLWLTLFCAAFALPTRFPRPLVAATVGLITLSAIMWARELGYRRIPVIPVRDNQTIYIIGDSISAGIRNEKQPWPECLRRDYRLDVINLAQAGATVQSAVQQAQDVRKSNSVAIVEIGGNDFFSETKASDFARNLDQLLAILVKQKHTIAMFELPLLPFHNAFGDAQRMLAAKYNIVLIPKTYMASVLGKAGATVDGLHLSKSGHEAMARSIYQMLKLEPVSP
jgi:acyl-CoA thioesterase-1